MAEYTLWLSCLTAGFIKSISNSLKGVTVMKQRQLKALAMFAIPHSVIIIFCLIMIFTGLASPFINSFALDKDGRLYVGEGKTLRVFQDGAQVYRIAMPTNTYAFEINSANELIVAYPSTVYRMDLEGNVLEKQDDPVSETLQKIEKSGKKVTTASGDEYRKVSEFGWTRIIKNGTEEVYRLSILSFAVKMLLVLCGVSLFVNGIWLITRYKKAQ